MNLFGDTYGMKCMIVTTGPTDSFSLNAAEERELEREPVSIFWDNGGTHGKIPVERVRNAVRLRSELRGAGRTLAPLSFHWCDTIVSASCYSGGRVQKRSPC